MNPHPIYQVTSIGRPLDPSWPTNRAVLILMPVAAILAAAAATLRGGDAGTILVAMAAIRGAIGAFGGWALARELAPDSPALAFASMGLAFAALQVFAGSSVLLLFTTMFLVRIVNRSTGLTARFTDSLAAILLTAWTIFSIGNPMPGLIAAIAFSLDAVLPGARRRQWLFAALGLAAAVGSCLVFGFGPKAGLPPGPAAGGSAVFIGALFAIAIARTGRITSPGDATGVPLSAARVRAGMILGLAAALQFLPFGNFGFETAACLWGTLAGAGLQALKRGNG